jgi:hypothetical protein
VGDVSGEEAAHGAELFVEVVAQFVVDEVPADVAVRSLDESVERHRHHQDDLPRHLCAGSGHGRDDTPALSAWVRVRRT